MRLPFRKRRPEKEAAEPAPRPEPEVRDLPDSPTDLTKPSWGYVLRKTVREFGYDQCTDLAAALTYFSVLAIFPALLAIVSIIGLFVRGPAGVDALLGVAEDLGQSSVADTVRPVLEQLAASQAVGFALVVGLVGALWSASGYVGAFGRALNRIYRRDEGRPVWKLRPVLLLVTVVIVVLIALVALLLVVSGPVARAIGDVIGLGSVALTTWSIVKWPVLALVVVFIVALLYYATPNVKQPRFRWISVGAVTAIVVWALASAGFAIYVANFANYNATYGSLGGVIVFLLWLWITNIALLFGAELDAELERGRELQAGVAAEHEVQLPHRDTRKIEKTRAKVAEDVERARALRESHGENSDPEDQ